MAVFCSSLFQFGVLGESSLYVYAGKTSIEENRLDQDICPEHNELQLLVSVPDFLKSPKSSSRPARVDRTEICPTSNKTLKNKKINSLKLIIEQILDSSRHYESSSSGLIFHDVNIYEWKLNPLFSFLHFPNRTKK